MGHKKLFPKISKPFQDPGSQNKDKYYFCLNIAGPLKALVMIIFTPPPPRVAHSDFRMGGDWSPP